MTDYFNVGYEEFLFFLFDNVPLYSPEQTEIRKHTWDIVLDYSIGYDEEQKIFKKQCELIREKLKPMDEMLSLHEYLERNKSKLESKRFFDQDFFYRMLRVASYGLCLTTILKMCTIKRQTAIQETHLDMKIIFCNVYNDDKYKVLRSLME